MSIHIRTPWLVAAAVALLSPFADAATTANLHVFSNADGDRPREGLVRTPDGGLYGTASPSDGTNDGTVWRYDGDGFIVMHRFSGSDGRMPRALIPGSDGHLYGATQATVFRMSPYGILTTLHDFGSGPGYQGLGALAQGPDGALYGTIPSGDPVLGSLFRLTLSGEFALIHHFNSSAGYSPNSLVAGDDDHLYGVARYGGPHGHGALFRVAPGGAVITQRALDASDTGDGYVAALINGGGGVLYGVTQGFGDTAGTVFRYVPATDTWTTLHRFTGEDGDDPVQIVAASDGMLHGITRSGGAYGRGSVFRLDPDGVLVTLHHFDVAGGSYPISLVADTSGRLFGATEVTGDGIGAGTLFSVVSDEPLAAPVAIGATPGDTTAQIFDQQCETATVSDATGVPVGNVVVHFVRSGSNPGQHAVESDLNGRAMTCWVGTSLGSDTISISAGDVEIQHVVTWARRAPSLVADDATSVGLSGSLAVGTTMSAHLTDPGTAAPLVDRTLRFYSNGQWACTAQTNGYGTAVCDAPLKLLQGKRYNVQFDGDPVYAPATASGDLLVVGGSALH
ncbi:MAG: choice-of-anchor tandem repeat GloVer-containing protein [Sinimarinibacterium sp.]|jgi:uncharacterized repeat protein (TIGR03803 family)